MTACELPNCASVVCAAVCHAGLPLVILKLLVNIVATPFYFLLRMFQYQHVAEQRSWCVMPRCPLTPLLVSLMALDLPLSARTAYVQTVATVVKTRFGVNIQGDLSLLHGEPGPEPEPWPSVPLTQSVSCFLLFIRPNCGSSAHLQQSLSSPGTV